ncbi:MAG: hypothetical protein AAGI11_15165 [Pseudomonadota bacterium]
MTPEQPAGPITVHTYALWRELWDANPDYEAVTCHCQDRGWDEDGVDYDEASPCPSCDDHGYYLALRDGDDYQSIGYRAYLREVAADIFELCRVKRWDFLGAMGQFIKSGAGRDG